MIFWFDDDEDNEQTENALFSFVGVRISPLVQDSVRLWRCVNTDMFLNLLPMIPTWQWMSYWSAKYP